jgi:hypothetical protein
MKKQTWQQWSRECARDPSSPSKIRKGALAALTGTDVDVLDAFVPCLELYARTGNERVLEAARIVLLEMQPSTRWIARELIAFVMCWDDRERLWPQIVGPDLNDINHLTFAP